MSNKQCDDTLKTMSISYDYLNDFSTNRYEIISAKIYLKGFIKVINKTFENCFYFVKYLFLIYVRIYFFVFLKLYMFRHHFNVNVFVNTFTLKNMLNAIILIQLSALFTNPGYCINTHTQVSKSTNEDLRQSARDNQSSLIEGFSLALGINISTTVSDIQTFELNTQESQNDDYDILKNLHVKDDGFLITNNSSTILMPTSDTFIIGEQNIYKFVSRENILKHQFQNFSLSSTDKSQEINSKLPISKITTCPSCSLLEKAKIDNLESIKMHILRRLHLTRVPHVNTPLRVPESILENFYNNYSRHSNRESLNRNKTNLTKRKNFDLEDYKLNKPKKSKSISDGIFDENMQKDDSKAYNHDTSSQTLIYEEDIYSSNKEEEEDAIDHFTKHIFEDDTTNYISHIHSIFIFPIASKYRHNRKQEIFLFKFENSFLTVSKAILHIYIRGREYFRKTNGVQVMEENQNVNDIILVINRAVRRTNSMNYTHFMKLMEYHQQIPSGLGKWIQIEIDQLSQFWKENPGTTQGIIIKGTEPWMRNFIVTNDNNFILHVEVQAREHRRHKRSTSLDCQESDNEVRCCRYPLKVNFTNFGWHFVVAPTSFDAYFCNGECKVGYLEQYPHTHLASLTTSATPCCSPTKMSSLNLLYFNLDQNLVMSTIPNMSVEKCSCS